MSIKHIFIEIKRRLGWFVERITFRKLMNLMICLTHFAIKSDKMLACWPVIVKIDISPLCNLRCIACVHSHPNKNKTLAKQKFDRTQMMTVNQFKILIDEIKGKSTAVSLYYLGDPLMHPNLDTMCKIAHESGLNVHISTNFSYDLTDNRLKQIIRSGLTHLTVCVDGLSQEKYQLTRVGGNIDLVISNLKRICLYKREYNQIYPKIEIQYLRYQHNLDEEEKAKCLFHGMGVDQVTTFWGSLHNFTECDPGMYKVHGPKRGRFIPQCYWPYFTIMIKYNGDVIPCCGYRHGTQYTNDNKTPVLGNVFDTSVREVWNSPKYREVRCLVSNPELIRSVTSLEESYCYGCCMIFNTDINNVIRNGDNYKFEELYTLNDHGLPFRTLI